MPSPSSTTQVLLIGGRSGVGKSSTAFALSELWQQEAREHCLVDGDNLSAAYPKPHEDPDGGQLTETNLRALWRTYKAAGYRRVIYVNTVSVLEHAMVARALGGAVEVRAALLTAPDDVVAARLGERETGSALIAHLRRSAMAASRLHQEAAPWVARVPTEQSTPAQVAQELADIALGGEVQR
ncbi:AAA family ATPase [Actinotalea sp. C106]|uniref:AAA family ATPase n=1 Tax=Actinotalea sp. C106 TaxID=2908644 RepID=UPI002028F3ED|nr:AAA family ATPase [Actinotalea sp. C106]